MNRPVAPVIAKLRIFKVEEMAVGVQSECQGALQPLFLLSQDQIKAPDVRGLSVDNL
jgi:hypothetical protein